MSAQFLFIHVNLLAPLESPDTIPISEATILAQLIGHGFGGEILGDFANSPLKPGTLAEALRRVQPLAIGFTAYQENMEQIRLWARFAKRRAPTVKTVLGGPQATFMPAEALRQMPEIDFLCRGEGEEVMLALAQALTEVTDVASVPGLCFLRGSELIETGWAYGAAHLDAYPSPYLMDLIDLRHKERAILLTSRGCRYDCAFCYTPRASRRQVRFYSPGRILDEMKHLRSRGVRAFWFADTNFSVSRRRLVALLEAMIKEVPGISFWCQTRYDLVNRELLSLLRRAGADNVAYGLESANAGVLERIRKPIDLERLSAVIRLTQEAGMRVELFSMFGLPGETFDQALGTLSFVKKNRVAISGNSISQQAHLFFGAPMNDDPEAFGIYPFRRTRPSYLSVCRDYATDTMSEDEIRRMSLIWRLNREDFFEDVKAGRNLFHRAAIITQNRRALAGRPEAVCLLARIYLALEEYGAASDCMRQAREAFPEDPTLQALLEEPLVCFNVSQEKARPGCKVIYDCQGKVDGHVVPVTCSRFQEAILGNGMLLPAFEDHLDGMAPGEYARFDVTFPVNYGQTALAGQVVTFRVHVHHTMEPVMVSNVGDLGRPGWVNEYALEDTEGLRQHNIHLYYRVVHQFPVQGRSLQMMDCLALINLYLKLGFADRAVAVMAGIAHHPMMVAHGAHLFRVNAEPQRALDLLETTGQNGPRERLIRAQCLFDLNRLEESETIVKDMELPKDIPVASLQVALATKLCLPVETYLERADALLDARMEAMLLDRGP